MEMLQYLLLIDGRLDGIEIDRTDGAALPSGLVYLSLHTLKFSDFPLNPSSQKPTTVLTLSECNRVPATFGNLAALQHVQIGDCDSLLGLHLGAFECLPKLKRLEIGFCSYLYKLPWTLGNSVESLRLVECHDLSALPDALVLRLKRMEIHDCRGLLKLPEAIGNSHAFEHLEILRCDLLSMLPDIKLGCLQKLKKLVIKGCRGLHFLPSAFLELQGLEHLSLHDASLHSIPNFEKLRS